MQKERTGDKGEGEDGIGEGEEPEKSFSDRARGVCNGAFLRKQDEGDHDVGDGGPGDEAEQGDGEGGGGFPDEQGVIRYEGDGDGESLCLERFEAVVLEGSKVEKEQRKEDDPRDDFPALQLCQLEKEKNLNGQVQEMANGHPGHHVGVVQRDSRKIVYQIQEAERENALDAETVVAYGKEVRREVPENVAVEGSVETGPVVDGNLLYVKRESGKGEQ